MSLLSHLECSLCTHPFPADIVQTFCKDCQAPLLAKYDLEAARSRLDRNDISRRPRGLWRWQELLPVHEVNHRISLGEGDTPLITLTRIGNDLGLQHLYLKDEGRNPTGTFKARGFSVAVSKAKELGIERLFTGTAGNAGGALATYATRALLAAIIFMPLDSPLANINECRIAGADLNLIDGLINIAAQLADEKARIDSGFVVSTFKEPYRVEGKKIMGYELAESFAWQFPDVILIPTAGGTGLIGIWKAFKELRDLGWLTNNNSPRLIAVQPEGCAPLVKAFTAGAATCEPWIDVQTVVAGLRVPKSFADRLILQAIRECEGTAIAVSDATILVAQRQLACEEGALAAPEGAAALAGLIQLVKSGRVKKADRIVLLNTGTGLKYL